MNHNFVAEYDGVKVRQIQEKDLIKLMEWRNDAQNGKYLSKIQTITLEMQIKWYNQYLKDDSIILFAIEETKELNRLVGSVAIYDFKRDLSNCGKTMIGDPQSRGRNLGGRGEVLALHVGFQKRGIKKFVTEINKENIASCKMAENIIGFNIVGERYIDGRIEKLYELPFDEFYLKHPYLVENEVKLC